MRLIVALLWAASLHPSTGLASFYGPRHHGKTMANGSIFNQFALTCAHRSLPFGTVIEVTRGSKSVICTVTDRGPFIKGRALDLSLGAAQALGITGVSRVRYEVR